ncbi:hypothetical protein ACFW6C_17820 [Streptomyces fungicidicus]
MSRRGLLRGVSIAGCVGPARHPLRPAVAATLGACEARHSWIPPGA